MPVVDTERATMPRSALRYRSSRTEQTRPVSVTSATRRRRPDAQNTTAPVIPDDLEGERPRSAASARRNPASRKRASRRPRPLLLLSIGLLAALVLWVGVTQVVNWGKNTLNTIKYGDPRTFQIDAVVGHGDSNLHPSHFLAINLHGVVTIFEMPAGDPGRARVLASTSVPGSDASLAVVTLRFVEVNHNSKPDMLINIDGMESVLVNDGKTFRPPTVAEQQQILGALHQEQ